MGENFAHCFEIAKRSIYLHFAGEKAKLVVNMTFTVL